MSTNTEEQTPQHTKHYSNMSDLQAAQIVTESCHTLLVPAELFQITRRRFIWSYCFPVLLMIYTSLPDSSSPLLSQTTTLFALAYRKPINATCLFCSFTSFSLIHVASIHHSILLSEPSEGSIEIDSPRERLAFDHNDLTY